MSEEEKLNKLKTDPAYFTEIYEVHRLYSLNFMRKMNGDEAVILDIYQDAVIILYEKSKLADFKLSCSIQTYLNSICRNQLLNRFKDSSRFISNSDDFSEDITDWFSEDSSDLNNERISALQNGLNKLKETGGNCYDILVRYFFNNESMKAIAKSLGYTNGDNVKNQKARCQKKLKDIAFQQLKSI